MFGIQKLFILVMSGGKLQGKHHELKCVAGGTWKVVFLLSSVFQPDRVLLWLSSLLWLSWRWFWAMPYGFHESL